MQSENILYMMTYSNDLQDDFKGHSSKRVNLLCPQRLKQVHYTLTSGLEVLVGDRGCTFLHPERKTQVVAKSSHLKSSNNQYVLH